MHNVTFSLALEVGLTHYDWLDGRTIEKSGREVALASHSVSPENVKALTTSATYGPLFGGSSPSTDLQSCLENRLRQRLDVNGSLEYELTWKQWDMLSGPPICALRASGRRTSDRGCSGWPTPRTVTGGAESAERKQVLGRTKSGGGDLQATVLIAGWVNPSTRDWKDSPGMATEGTNPDGTKRTGCDQLPRQAAIAGWKTQNACDGEGGVMEFRDGKAGHYKLRDHAAWAGRNTSSSPAPTEKRGVLNPGLCRWLMGYPVEWCQAAILAGRMLRTQRKKDKAE